MAELFRQQGIGATNIQDIQASMGNVENLREASKIAKNVSDDMKQKSMTLFALEFETEARESLNVIYSRNNNDPDNLTKEIKSYQQAVEKKVPFSILPQLRSRFASISQPLITQATSNRNKELDNQLSMASLNNQNQLLLDISNNAENLIDTDPNKSDDEKRLLATQSFNSIATSFDSLQGNLSLTKADGSPLYTPQQQQKLAQTAQYHMLRSAAMGWLGRAPNKVAAYSDWKAGKVNISTLDENNKPVDINIRNSFSPDLIKKVDRDMVAAIRDDLWIQNKLRKEEESFIKARGEEIAKNLEEKAQDNILSLQEVEQQRGSLAYKDYRDFRKKAITGSGITDGRIYAQLADRSARGEDVSEEVRYGMFETRTISYSDGADLLKINEKTTGFQNPVTEGRKHLQGILGVNESLAGESQTGALANANAEYNRQTRAFVEDQRRQPTYEESVAIAENVAPPFSLADNRTTISQQALPMFMDRRYKIGPAHITKDIVSQSKEKTRRHFLAKYNGDAVKASKDKQLLSQIRLLNKYEAVAIENEGRLAKRRNR